MVIILPHPPGASLICSFPSPATLFPWLHFSLLPSPPLLKHLNLRGITSCNYLGMANPIPLILQMRGQRHREGTGLRRSHGSQGQGWDDEPRVLPICCTSPTHQDPCWEINQTRHLNSGETANISSTYKWGNI